jgi:hypothetical protein
MTKLQLYIVAPNLNSCTGFDSLIEEEFRIDKYVSSYLDRVCVWYWTRRIRIVSRSGMVAILQVFVIFVDFQILSLLGIDKEGGM